jgi:hypothetical protein
MCMTTAITIIFEMVAAAPAKLGDASDSIDEGVRNLNSVFLDVRDLV